MLECIGDDFLWLTDKRGKSLLKWFVEREKVITFDDALSSSKVLYGVKIYNADNYMNSPRLFTLLRGGWRGFVWDGRDDVCPENEKITLTEPYRYSRDGTSFQQALVEGMGFAWRQQDYAPCRIEQDVCADVGLNWHVHPEWRSKCWLKENWEYLAEALQDICAISWQQGLDNLDKYISWLASCQIIVTPDTFGLHLASALRKKVIAIVGPTGNREFSYSRVVSLKPLPHNCMPCNSPTCKTGEDCLSEITVERVADAIIEALSKNNHLPVRLGCEK